MLLLLSLLMLSCLVVWFDAQVFLCYFSCCKRWKNDADAAAVLDAVSDVVIEVNNAVAAVGIIVSHNVATVLFDAASVVVMLLL